MTHNVILTDEQFAYIKMLIVSDKFEDSNENEYEMITNLRDTFNISENESTQ
jgi:hypothetical protein